MRIKKILSKGFTLVELLIVIALLGALAIGLIGAIDPFEQLKKGTDTGTRNNVSEIQSAVIRYYALKGRMPWCPAAGECTTDLFPSGTALSVGVMDAALSNIVESGELKSNFSTVNSAELGKIFVTGSTEEAIACFQPVSKSFRSDNNSKYNITGDEGPAGCPSGTMSTCYWCVQ